MSPERGENITSEAREISPELQRAANQARDSLLRGNKEAFKEFRQNHPEVPIDFSRKSIGIVFDESLDLSNCKFIGSDLSQSRINGANFEGADFSKVKFTILPGETGLVTPHGSSSETCSDIKNSNFKNANFTDAILRNSLLKSCSFSGANFEGTQLSGTHFDKNCHDLGDNEIMWARFVTAGYSRLVIDSEPDEGRLMMQRVLQERKSILQELVQQDLDERGKEKLAHYLDIAFDTVKEYGPLGSHFKLESENKNLEYTKWRSVGMCALNLELKNCSLRNSEFKSPYEYSFNLKLVDCNLQETVFKGDFGQKIDFTGSNLSNANFKDAVIYKRQIKTAANTEGVIWPDKPREKIDADLQDKKELTEIYEYYEKLGVKLPSVKLDYKYSEKTFFRKNIDIYEEQEEKLDEQDRINWPIIYSIETKNMREKLSKKELAEVFIVLYALKKSIKLDKNQMKRATDILAIQQRDKTNFYTTEDAVADAVQDVSEGAVLGREEYRRLATSTRRSSE